VLEITYAMHYLRAVRASIGLRILLLIGVSSCASPTRHSEILAAGTLERRTALWAFDRGENRIWGGLVQDQYRPRADAFLPFPAPCRMGGFFDGPQGKGILTCLDDSGKLTGLKTILLVDPETEPGVASSESFPAGLDRVSVAGDGSWLGVSGRKVLTRKHEQALPLDGTVVAVVWSGDERGTGAVVLRKEGSCFFIPVRERDSGLELGEPLTLAPTASNAVPAGPDGSLAMFGGEGSDQGVFPPELFLFNPAKGSLDRAEWPRKEARIHRLTWQHGQPIGLSYQLDRGWVVTREYPSIPVFGRPVAAVMDESGRRLFALAENARIRSGLTQTGINVVNLRRNDLEGKPSPRVSAFLPIRDASGGKSDGDWSDLTYRELAVSGK
jgi:hypothetical protein